MASAGASRHIELFFKIFQEGVVQAAWSVRGVAVGRWGLLGLVGLLGVPACVGSVDGPNGSTAPSQAALDGELATPAVDPTAESGGDRGPAESAPQSGSEAVDADGFNEPSRSAGPVKQEGVGAQGGPGTTDEVIPSEANAGEEPTSGRADPGDAAAVTPQPGLAPANPPDDRAASGGPAVPDDADDSSARPTKEASPRPPPGSNLVTRDELNQRIAEDWPEPQAVLFISGQQHGYLEPCGCTGLDRQKGGLIRRDTLIQQIRERGWTVLPVDVGNQVRRIGRQAEIKFQTTVEAFKIMEYRAATLGVDDLKLSSIELIQAASSDELNATGFITANVEILDPSFFPTHRIVEAGGRKIGITGFTDESYRGEIASADVVIHPAAERVPQVVADLRQKGCDFIVLLAHASIERSAEVARQAGHVDLVVTAGGYGEPTLLPEPIEGTSAVMVQCGVKGMYGGIVGLFDDPQQPLRYQRIAISAQFPDSPRMLELFAKYQDRLKREGYEGLGIRPVLHPTGRQFVGSETCGDCHTTAYDIWKGTPHFHATDSIVAPPNDRGGIPRHFDPECISCHVTGWHPQDFYPYVSGWMSLEATPHLVGSGCENCHGPGQEHVAAENGDIDVDNDQLLELRKQMVLQLDRARDKCLECHDLDNSPDFHHDGAFEEYWEQVKHYGKD